MRRPDLLEQLRAVGADGHAPGPGVPVDLAEQPLLERRASEDGLARRVQEGVEADVDVVGGPPRRWSSKSMVPGVGGVSTRPDATMPRGSTPWRMRKTRSPGRMLFVRAQVQLPTK